MLNNINNCYKNSKYRMLNNVKIFLQIVKDCKIYNNV